MLYPSTCSLSARGSSATHNHEQTHVRRGQPAPVWQQVQSAIWLIGLAILFWQGWWFPGILVLVAISGLTQALLAAYVSRKDEARARAAEARMLEEEREFLLPDACPNCGGPIAKSSVRWTGKRTAACPFCGSSLKVTESTPRPAPPQP